MLAVPFSIFIIGGAKSIVKSRAAAPGAFCGAFLVGEHVQCPFGAAKFVAERGKPWYNKTGTAGTVGGWSLPGRGVMLMVTYEGLFAFCLVIIGVIGLVVQIYKRK